MHSVSPLRRVISLRLAYAALPVTVLIGLVTLPFKLLTLK